MKNLLLSLSLCLFNSLLEGQNCPRAVANTYLHANTIGARVNSGGNLFNESHFIPNPKSDSTGPSTFYVAAMWFAGKNQAGHIRLFAPNYNAPVGGFAGPVNIYGFADNPSCFNWDKVFKISGTRIKQFLAVLPELTGNPDLAVQQYPDILGWPALGNPYFTTIQDFDLPAGKSLAPFFDLDQNGLYNPLEGDYPVVQLGNTLQFVPEEWVWSIYNSVGGSNQLSSIDFHVEVQLTTWAFNCPNKIELNNSIFTAHRVLFDGKAVQDSCFVGIFADLDIGCDHDDYIGCNPNLSAFFAYNQNALDGQVGRPCSTRGSIPFEQHAPVQSVSFLNWSMDKFIYFNRERVGNPPWGTIDPEYPAECYEYLNGHWRDGSPITEGGSGYNPSGGVPTNFALPGDPADPNAWSMCSAGLDRGDRRGLGLHYLGAVQPGRLEEFVTAWTYHPNPDLPCGLGTTFADIAQIRALHTDGFRSVCSPLTAAP